MTNPYAEAAADLAATTPGNRYSATASDLAQDQRTQLRTSVYGGAATSPDAARIARQSGLPPDLVNRNLPAVQQRLTVDRVDSDTAEAPRLRERYTDPAFAALAHDDSASLAKLETGIYTWRQATRKGVAGLKLSLDFAADQLARAFGADRTETQRILRETGAYYEAQGSDPVLAAAGERAKTSGGGTWYGTLVNLPGEIASSGDALGTTGRFMLEQLPASMVGFGLGAAVTAPARAAIVGRISAPLVARGVNAGLAGAAGNAGAVVGQSLGANYSEGLRQGLDEKAAASRAWTKTAAEVPANALAGAAMGLRIGPNQLANVLSQAGIQGAGGGSGAAMASLSVGETPDPIEIALEILGEGVSAVPEVAGLSLSRLSQTRTLQRVADAEAAQQNAQELASVMQAADATALKGRDRQAFAELVEHIEPERHVYIAPEHLQGVDLSAVPDVARRAAEAAATGGDVQLSMGELLAHLPGQQLLQHLRVEPEALTAAEAQALDAHAELANEMTGPPPDAPLLGQQGEMSATDWASYLAEADQAAAAAVQARDARALRDAQWLAANQSTTARKLAREAAAVRSELETDARAAVEARPVYAAQRMLETEAGRALPADYVAEMHGFNSADDMRQAIADAKPFADAVADEVDALLHEARPDLADDVARERAAEAATADRARVRFLATEAAALGEILGRRQDLERNAHAYAQTAIAETIIRRLRPNQHSANAERAARRAAEAFRRGETRTAASAKREQVLQTAMHGEATAAAAEIAQGLQGFQRMLRRTDEARDGNLVSTARAILAQYGLAAADKTAADYLAQVQNYDPELAADLTALMDGLPTPAEHRDLTVGEFRTVRERVEAVWTLARTTRQMEVDGQRIEIAQAAAELAAQLQGEKALPVERQVGTNDRLDLRMRLAGMRAALRRVEHWASARDRGSPAGPFTRLIWQPVSEAVTRYRAARNEHVGRFLQLLKTIEPTLVPGKIAAPELGEGVVFADRSALLHALLHTGNSSNKTKLLRGYGWADLNDDGSMNTARWQRFIDRMVETGRLTRADFDFAQATWDLMEQMKPAAQAAHYRMFGHHFGEISADPFIDPLGVPRAGGYIAAKPDLLLVPEARAYGAMDDLLAGQASPMFPAVNKGFTKGRIETYTRPLALDLRLLPAHLDSVARFAYLGPVLRDAARLVTRNKHFRESMNAVDPTAIESMLVPWLKRVATQTLTKAPESQADRAVARIANRARNRTGLLLMAGNVVNTIQQFTGLSVAALKVNPRHLAAGLLQLVRNPTATGHAINELSPWMAQRSDNGARDVDQAIDRMLTNPTALQRAEEFGSRWGYVLQQYAQNLIDRTVWLGAYRQAEARGDGDAVRQADAAVRQTQGSFAPEDAAKVEHASAFTRLALMFFSFFSSQANLIATEVQNARGSTARLMLVYLLGFAVPAFLADVIAKGIKGELDGDEDEALAAQLLKTFFLSQARYAVAMVPVAGQIGNAAIGQFTPERFDDRVGASPAYSAIEATVRAPFSAARAIQGEGDPRTAVRDGLTAVGLLTGLPTGPLIRPLGYLASDEAEDAPAGEVVRGLITGRAPN